MSEPADGRRAACFGRDPAIDGWPSVSVVMPVRNEAEHLTLAVDSVLRQAYPGAFDVWLAVAPSDDDTPAVARRLAADSAGHVHVVANPAGNTPAGLNAAIAASSGSIVVRVDGHAALPEGYVQQAVETMCRTGAVNVGGAQVPAPETPFEEAVAAATTSWLGTGGATYRVGGQAGPVDTVYLGVFDRAAGDEVGWFDERLVRNQDYELNIRLRATGGTIWFDPTLAVAYRPRGTWPALAKQYYEYGWWKAQVLSMYPGSLRVRQAVPPAAIAAAIVGGAASLRWRPAAVVPLMYLSTIALTVRHRRRLLAWTSTATIHTAWSAGLAVGIIAGRRRRAP